MLFLIFYYYLPYNETIKIFIFLYELIGPSRVRNYFLYMREGENNILIVNVWNCLMWDNFKYTIIFIKI